MPNVQFRTRIPKTYPLQADESSSTPLPPIPQGDVDYGNYLIFNTMQIRRMTTSQRESITPLSGEPILDLDLQKLYIGDGSTLGGNPVILPFGSTAGTVTEGNDARIPTANQKSAMSTANGSNTFLVSSDTTVVRSNPTASNHRFSDGKIQFLVTSGPDVGKYSEPFLTDNGVLNWSDPVI